MTMYWYTSSLYWGLYWHKQWIIDSLYNFRAGSNVQFKLVIRLVCIGSLYDFRAGLNIQFKLV